MNNIGLILVVGSLLAFAVMFPPILVVYILIIGLVLLDVK